MMEMNLSVVLLETPLKTGKTVHKKQVKIHKGFQAQNNYL